MKLLLVVLCIVLAACGERTPSLLPPEPSGSQTIRRVDADGRVEVVRRVDGNVHVATEADLTGGETPDVVVATGLRAGADQGRLMVIRGDGTVVLDHPLPYDTPFGSLRQAMTVGRRQIAVFRHEDRRFLLVAATGRWAPSVLSLFEFLPDGSVRERLRFWNAGTIRSLFQEGGRFGFQGVNNHLPRAPDETYATVVGTFVVPPPGVDRVDAISPQRIDGRDDDGSGFEAYAHLPALSGTRGDSLGPARVEGGHVVLRDAAGLVFRLDPARRVATVEAASPGPGDPPNSAAHVQSLRSHLKVWPR